MGVRQKGPRVPTICPTVRFGPSSAGSATLASRKNYNIHRAIVSAALTSLARSGTQSHSQQSPPSYPHSNLFNVEEQ